jgi:hypothetical protein
VKVAVLAKSSCSSAIGRDVFGAPWCSHTLYVPYGFGHTVHGFGTRLACFSAFSYRFEDDFADPRSPNHLHDETCSVGCRSLFCSTTLSNRNVFSSLSLVSLSKQH